MTQNVDAHYVSRLVEHPLFIGNAKLWKRFNCLRFLDLNLLNVMTRPILDIQSLFEVEFAVLEDYASVVVL